MYLFVGIKVGKTDISRIWIDISERIQHMCESRRGHIGRLWEVKSNMIRVNREAIQLVTHGNCGRRFPCNHKENGDKCPDFNQREPTNQFVKYPTESFPPALLLMGDSTIARSLMRGSGIARIVTFRGGTCAYGFRSVL